MTLFGLVCLVLSWLLKFFFYSWMFGSNIFLPFMANMVIWFVIIKKGKIIDPILCNVLMITNTNVIIHMFLLELCCWDRIRKNIWYVLHILTSIWEQCLRTVLDTRGGWIVFVDFSSFWEHSWEQFGLGVCSEPETRLLRKIINRTRCFYVENYLWPNRGVKNHDLPQ